MSNTSMPIQDQIMHDAALLEKVRLIAYMRKTPIVLYGIFLELVRQFYSSEDNLPLGISGITWNKEPAKSKMWIDTDYRWEDEHPEFRPAIYVKLGEIQYKLDASTGRSDALSDVSLEEGEQIFTRTGAGTISWVHVGHTKGESISLAGATLDYLDALSRMIRDDFCFYKFYPVSIAPISIDKESHERYRSIVTFAYEFEDTWSVKLESPKLKRIVLRAGQNLLDSGIL